MKLSLVRQIVGSNMDIMDIQAVESKLSDVTVTPIPRSQVQNFYNYQQQREQREQQPQIQISAIHAPRSTHVNDHAGHGTNLTRGVGRDLFSKSERDYHQQSSTSSTAAAVAAYQYTQQLQAQLALLQQHSNTTASPATARSAANSNNSNNMNGISGMANTVLNSSTQSQLKYPQSTSPISVGSAQSAAALTIPSIITAANLPAASTSTSSNGLTKYAQLLAVIEELGRDIRPTYTGSRCSTERLKRSLVHARILVRECLMETERSARP